MDGRFGGTGNIGDTVITGAAGPETGKLALLMVWNPAPSLPVVGSIGFEGGISLFGVNF